MSAKNPRTPPGPLSIGQSDIVTFSTMDPLFRIHTVHGNHPMPWNELREFGPLRQKRWDPHPLPVDYHPGIGVAYCTADPLTVFAEIFQSRRTIRINTDQALTAWLPSRNLRLLDLTGHWATQNGASASLHSAPKLTCRTWAQAIHSYSTDVQIDGIYTPSTMTLKPMIVLFSSARSAFPAAPMFSELLTHSVVKVIARKSAHTLKWRIL